MAAGHPTSYIGGDHKAYIMEIRIKKPEWMRVRDIEKKIRDIIKSTYRQDDTYYFDDDDSLRFILDYVEESDEYVYYSFVCDRETFKQLEKTRKYWGFEIEKTGGRWC